MAVQAGLRGRTSERPRQLRCSLQQDSSGSWRIAAITDLIDGGETPPSTLSGILADLLKPAAAPQP